MIHLITITVEYDETEPTDVEAIAELSASFEEQIAQRGLSLDDITEETLS